MFKVIDKNNKILDVDDTKKGEEYYCPICHNPVRKIAGEINAHHFRHIPNSNCPDNWEYDMSEWHRKMQLIFDDCFREVVVEKDGQKHRADILKDGVVIEFQHSNLSSQDFRERNIFYLSCGYKVVWVFDITESVSSHRFSISYVSNSDLSCIWNNPKRFLKFIPNSAFKSNPNFSVCLCWDTESGYEIGKIKDADYSFKKIKLEILPELSNDLILDSLFVENGINGSAGLNANSLNSNVSTKDEFINICNSLGSYTKLYYNVGKLGFKRYEMVCPKEPYNGSWIRISKCEECKYCGAIEKMHSDSNISQCCYCYYPKIVNPCEEYICPKDFGEYLHSKNK